jgi:hypothetical protein
LVEVLYRYLPEGLRGTTKTSVRIADVPTEIQNTDLPNISL